MIETLKIILGCVAAAILYGVVHDQITARICIEYFTVFHPPVFITHSPTLLGLGWGIIATWWVGLFLGLLLALATRAGSRPKLSATQQIRPIAKLLLVMACCALIAGLTGFVLARHGFLAEPYWIAPLLVSSSYPAFVAAWCAHSVSYASGFFGGLILCILQYRKRVRVESPLAAQDDTLAWGMNPIAAKIASVVVAVIAALALEHYFERWWSVSIRSGNLEFYHALLLFVIPFGVAFAICKLFFRFLSR